VEYASNRCDIWIRLFDLFPPLLYISSPMSSLSHLLLSEFLKSVFLEITLIVAVATDAGACPTRMRPVIFHKIKQVARTLETGQKDCANRRR
jgi:hypothetical protein